MLLTEQDIYHFREGTHVRAYDKLGAHLVRGEQGDVQGTHFAVWAPNAREVSVVGDFNGWDPTRNRMHPRLDSSGIWETFVADVEQGTLYKYHIVSRNAGYTVKKADPYAFHAETPPRTASVVWDLAYEWGDSEWLAKRARANALDAPWCIYELHIGSWRRVPEEHGRPLNYRELAHAVADYVTEMGFTHVELMPVMEHPFYGSWGYQITGFYAPTSRYGSPQDFMYFVDHLHRRGIGVILDWVPSHFPTDEHGLSYFDGTHLYEHADPRKGFHPEWNSSIFNYGRSEVRNFLASNAVFWLDVYHADALRVDAVASMLYLDYGRKSGEWIPNIYGGHENLEAVEFLKQLNLAVYRDAPHAQTIAEESTAWPMVSRPTYVGGLGFGLKWNMGWMHDTLKYFQNNPVHRKYVHNQLTFSLWYAFTENFVLPLSHDEVVHGKGALIGKMPGDEWQQFANLRLLLAYMWMHPGKKLLFMGGEIGQKREWHHDESLEWHVLQYPLHAGVQRLVRDLNKVVRGNAALHQIDFASEGFQWVDANNSDDSVLVFLRKGRNGEVVLVAANFTPVPRREYRVGAPVPGTWQEVLNSDAADYGGSGIGNFGAVEAVPHPSHGQPCSLTLQLPPLALVMFAPARAQQPGASSGSAASAAPGPSYSAAPAVLGPQPDTPVPVAQLNVQQAAPPAASASALGSPQPRSPRTVFTSVATPWLAASRALVEPPPEAPATSTAPSTAPRTPAVSATAAPPAGTLLPELVTPDAPAAVQDVLSEDLAPAAAATVPSTAAAASAASPAETAPPAQTSAADRSAPESSIIAVAALTASPPAAARAPAREIPQLTASVAGSSTPAPAEPAAGSAARDLHAATPAVTAAELTTPLPESPAPVPVCEIPAVSDTALTEAALVAVSAARDAASEPPASTVDPTPITAAPLPENPEPLAEIPPGAALALSSSPARASDDAPPPDTPAPGFA